jgi:hypothetical protein
MRFQIPWVHQSGRLRPGEQLLSRSALEQDALHRVLLLPLAVWPDQREDWMGVHFTPFSSSNVLASIRCWLPAVRMR